MASREELLQLEEAAWAEFVAEVGRVPEHRRSDDGVVPGWSVTDLVFHNGKWAGVAAVKLEAIGASGSAGEEDSDEVWRGANDRWAKESKSLSYEEAMKSALADREAARKRRPRGSRRRPSTTTRSTRRKSGVSRTASAFRRSSRSRRVPAPPAGLVGAPSLPRDQTIFSSASLMPRSRSRPTWRHQMRRVRATRSRSHNDLPDRLPSTDTPNLRWRGRRTMATALVSSDWSGATLAIGSAARGDRRRR
jgi:hypothetical protein